MNCEEKLGLLKQQMHEMDQDINNYLDRISELQEENGDMAEKHADKDIAINNLLKSNKQLQAFYDYFSELYGKGLEVANWHMNGELEPFDEFFESAEKEMV